MGLFDHLFKPRPEDTVERIVEAPLKASGHLTKPAGEDEAVPDAAATFLQPKGYSRRGAPGAGQNQGFVPVLPGPRRHPHHPPQERKPAPGEHPPSAANEIVLMVGDVLPRIPVGLLRPGSHDLKRPLRFRIEHLSSDIARGKPGIALSVIAEQCPELFHTAITDDEDMEIRLPLQKIVEQITRIRAGAPAVAPRPAPAPAPAAVPPPPVTPRIEKIPAPIPPPAIHVEPPPVAVTPPPPVAVTPPPPVTVAQPPPVAVAPPPPPPPVVVVVEAPPPPPPPPPVVAREPEPAPVEEEEKPAPPPLAAVPEPVVVPEPEMPVTEAEPIEPEEPEPEPEPEPEEVTEPKPEIFRTALEAIPPTIELSFAAMVAKLPEALLAGERPKIAEGERIVLPFPMIERQLGTGAVEIPAAIFWVAVPPLLKHHFVFRSGVSVPVPLEEIFQNLPVGGPSEKPRFDPVPPPLEIPPAPEIPTVLAPAPSEEQTPELGLDLTPPPAPPAPEEPPPVEEPAPPAPVAETPAVPPPQESPVNAPPDADAPAHIHLQPLRIFTPPVPTVEAFPAAAPASAESVLLGTAPPPSATPTETSHILAPSESAAEKEKSPEPASGVESAPEPPVTPPPAPSSPAPAAEEKPLFSVLPSPAAPPPPPPEPETTAFNPDQPPPLQIEPPAAAVAVLRGATVAAPEESPLFATATTSVQAPRIFRPVVLPPPIAGAAAPATLNLAPTLAGSGTITPGLVSLAPATSSPPPPVELAAPPPPPISEPPPPPPKPEPQPPAEPETRESKPTLRDLARRLFAPAPTVPEPAAPPAPEPVASQPATAAPPTPEPVAPPAPTAPSPGLHLHIPALPQNPPPPAPAPPLPALPISRFDQHSLQSIFMTDETLDLPKISRLAAALPGIQACIIGTRGENYTGGTLPEGFDIATLRGLAPQIGAAATRLPLGELKNFTLYGNQYSISFFERPTVCLCAIHRARSFIPGVREKLVSIADELAREE